MHIALQSSIGTKINLWSSTMKVFEKTHNVVMNSFCSTSALQDIHEILKEFIGEKVIKCPWIFSSNEKLPLMRFWHAMTFEAILYATKVLRKFNVTNKRRTHFISKHSLKHCCESTVHNLPLSRHTSSKSSFKGPYVFA